MTETCEYEDGPVGHAEHLDADECAAVGLDETGRDGDPRFPHTVEALTADERARLTTHRARLARERLYADRRIDPGAEITARQYERGLITWEEFRDAMVRRGTPLDPAYVAEQERRLARSHALTVTMNAQHSSNPMCVCGTRLDGHRVEGATYRAFVCPDGIHEFEGATCDDCSLPFGVHNPAVEH